MAFVAMRMHDQTNRFVGSAFWLGRDIAGQARTAETYLVTARHVIDGIRRTGLEECWIRVNFLDGSAKWARTNVADWFVHPTDPSLDIAILLGGIPDGADHLVVPYSFRMTPEKAKQNGIAAGDEVFVVGLFSHHYGEQRNIPIVRIGNLATTDEERVNTSAFGKMDAYLIEARSLGGLSGSPVFLNPGLIRTIDGQIRHATGEITLLLGLIHGHYDVNASKIDAGDQATQAEKVNTGIAIVVPVRSIMTVIEAYEQTRGRLQESDT